MLTKCPECELQVSDRALTCPHCGFPLKQENISTKKTKRKNHMRLPNGFGRISEIKSRNLRNPYRAMVTKEFTEQGKPIGKIVGYYKTYNEAYEALVEYHKSPTDISDNTTMQELYERFRDEKEANGMDAMTLKNYTGPWQYCWQIYDLKVRDFRVRHVKFCIEKGTVTTSKGTKVPSENVKKRIKVLLNELMDYAVLYELADKNYAREYRFSAQKTESEAPAHISFTDEEMAKLWEHSDELWISVILIHCYTGWRPQELLKLKLENINLDDMTMRGGMKTAAGKNRLVPIHPKIQELVKKIYHLSESRGHEYFISCETKNTPEMTYEKYRWRFIKVCEELHLNPEHSPHDCRKQFVTMAKKYHVDDFAIKRLVGHTIKDITEKIYTDRDIAWLRNELEKIQQ